MSHKILNPNGCCLYLGVLWPALFLRALNMLHKCLYFHWYMLIFRCFGGWTSFRSSEHEAQKSTPYWLLLAFRCFGGWTFFKGFEDALQIPQPNGCCLYSGVLGAGQEAGPKEAFPFSQLAHLLLQVHQGRLSWTGHRFGQTQNYSVLAHAHVLHTASWC